MKITMIVPIVTDVHSKEVEREFKAYASKGTEIEIIYLDKGPVSIRSAYAEFLAAPDILKKAIEAEKKGFDGIIIACFGDVGVKAAREIVDIPVIGAAEPSMLIACSLGQRFSVVTISKSIIPPIENIATVLGVKEKLASVRSITLPVSKDRDEEKLKNDLYEEAVRSIEEDKAHVIVLGCAGMIGIAESLHEMLKEKGYDVPIVEPAATSILFLETLIKLKLTQSRLTYMCPPEKLE